ncbi:3456_t:CDS:2, partial [Scutellospora calospora]
PRCYTLQLVKSRNSSIRLSSSYSLFSVSMSNSHELSIGQGFRGVNK